MINVDPPRSLPNQGWENCSLRSKRFRLVWEEINTEDFAPLFSRSLTLVFRLNFKSIHKYFYNEGTKIRTPFVKEAW